MSYELRLRAIGRLIDLAKIRDVCVMEVSHGAIVVGRSPMDSWEYPTGKPASLQIPNDLIQRIIAEIASASDDQQVR